ncbi:LuxR C-terminal-related transcriptional regulator [Umezawaea sp. NPDC059074]|uniref:response regulator transcription factor n=1 Tax=Umezawaea sp. NPDC059074 TaxID=3346716 RepID=UPI003688905D
MSMRKIAVVVHDGDPLSRAGVIEFLENRSDLVVLDGLEYREGSVAVVLVDVLDASTVSRLRGLVADLDQRVVLVVGELDEAQVGMVLDVGARTVVLRHQLTAERLVKAVEAAARGEGDPPPRLLAHLTAQVRGTRRKGRPPSEPTERELGVLRLVADGLDTREIAERLSYSERTVKGVLYDVMARKHWRNRAHAVAFAVREGYI